MTEVGRREGTGSSQMTMMVSSQQKESLTCAAVHHEELAEPWKPIHPPESKLHSLLFCASISVGFQILWP